MVGHPDPAPIGNLALNVQQSRNEEQKCSVMTQETFNATNHESARYASQSP